MVSALSGYVLGTDGQPAIAFSILANEVPDASTALRAVMDETVVTVAKSLVESPP